MRRTSQALWALILLLTGGGAGVLLRGADRPARAQGTAIPSYEYQVEDLRSFGPTGGTKVEKDRLFNDFGKEGWRLAGVIGQTVVFERSRVAGAPARRPGSAPEKSPTSAPPAESID